MDLDEFDFAKCTEEMDQTLKEKGLADSFVALWKSCDQDSNGDIEFEELIKMFYKIGLATKKEVENENGKFLQKMHDTFRQMDINGDGHLTQEEFVRFLYNMNH